MKKKKKKKGGMERISWLVKMKLCGGVHDVRSERGKLDRFMWVERSQE